MSVLVFKRVIVPVAVLGFDGGVEGTSDGSDHDGGLVSTDESNALADAGGACSEHGMVLLVFEFFLSQHEMPPVGVHYTPCKSCAL